MSSKHRHGHQAPRPAEEETRQLGLERLVFFSDAVFAIAITLMALEIRLPSGDFNDDRALTQALLEIFPQYLGFAISFWVIAVFWVVHHRLFSWIERFDSTLIAINFLLLMFIAFVPFPTAVLSEYGNRTAVILYAGTMIAIGLTTAGMTAYATGRGRLISASLPPGWRQRSYYRTFSFVAVFAVSIGIAFIDPNLATLSWLLLIPLRLWGREPSNR